MPRVSLLIAAIAICAARDSAADVSGNEATAVLHGEQVSTLLEQVAKAPLGKGDANVLRAVADLMAKEEAVANARDYAPLPGEAKPTRLCFRLRNSPAADVAKSIQDAIDRNQIGRPGREAAEWNRIVLACEPTTNSVLISAPPHVVESATKLLSDLDARPPMITFKVLIGELKAPRRDGKATRAAADVKVPSMQEDGAAWLAEATKQGRVDPLERPQVTTLEGQSATVEIGQRIPAMPGPSYQTVGAILSLTPRILPSGQIAAKLDFKHSQIDQTAPALTIRKSGIQTTFTAKEGQTTIVRVSGEREMIVALTPQICRQKAGGSSAADKPDAALPTAAALPTQPR